jgi:hypothetical protein
MILGKRKREDTTTILYNDFTYNDFTYNDFTYNDFTYNTEYG